MADGGGAGDRGLDEDLRRLERRMDAELRAEQAEYEELAALAELRSRTLRHVALELLHRGDDATFLTPAGPVSGVVVATADDLAVVRSGTALVDVHLGAPVAIRLDRGSAPRPAGAPPTRAASFRARLAEREAARAVVDVGTLVGPLPGVRIAAVAPDHVLVDAGVRSAVAISAICWVRSRGDGAARC